MNTEHFNEYIGHCQKIERALSYLPNNINLNAVLAAWSAGGLFGFQNEPPRLWLNVAAHMSVSAVLGYKLALFMEDDLGKEGLTPRDIVEALLVHDWAKRLEADVRTNGIEIVIRAVEKHQQMLLQQCPKIVVALAVATGDNGVRITEARLLTLGEKIIFYSDYCTSESCIVTFQKRLEDLLPQFAKGGRYAQTNDYYQKRYGMSHHKKLTQLLSPIQEEFVARTGRTAEDFPKNLIPVEFCG